MKITNFKEKNTFSLRNLLLDSDSHQVLSISEKEVDEMFAGISTAALQTGYGDNLKETLKNLGEPEIQSNLIKSAIMVIRCNKSYPLSISELPFVNAYIDQYLPNAFVRWGFSTKEIADKNIKILCLTAY